MAPPPRNARGGPVSAGTASLKLADAPAAKQDSRPSPVQRLADPGTARQPDPARELQAWRETVLYLHSLGLPAPATEFTSAWLRRRGIRADWETAA